MRLPHTTELGKETGGTPVLRRTPTESGHGRDARATNGGPPSPELRRGTRGERNVPFYQTNPPFFGGIFDGSGCVYIGCDGNL